jgi:hypothetical protein
MGPSVHSSALARGRVCVDTGPYQRAVVGEYGRNVTHVSRLERGGACLSIALWHREESSGASIPQL